MSAMEIDTGGHVLPDSPMRRICRSMFAAACVAPLLVLASIAGLGWNEHQAMCTQTAIAEAERQVGSRIRGCTQRERKATAGGLVLFSGPLSKKDLQPLRPKGHEGFEKAVSVVGVGLRTQVEMLQCVETVEKKTHKNKVGGGSKTVVTYGYRRAYLPRYQNSSLFKGKDTKSWKANCNAENPSWEGLPQPGVVYSSGVRVGAFSLSENLTRSVPLQTKVEGKGVPGWMKQGRSYLTEQWVQPGDNKHRIGSVRVSFFSNDWARKNVTVLGKNAQGRIVAWEASPTWLCKGASLLKLRMKDSWTKDAFFEDMRTEDSPMTWVWRAIGFVALWTGFGMMAGPIGTAADCLPCLGPKLGDAAESVACFVAVLPASCCYILVVGILWMALYPRFGVVAVILFGVGCASAAVFRSQQRCRRDSDAARRVTPLARRTGSAGSTPLMQAVPPPQP